MTGFESKSEAAADKQKEYDPCLHCIKGVVCRTPKCGRLALPLDHPFRNAQPAQEPVAHVYLFDRAGRPLIAWNNAKGIKIGDKLYTAPSQREWVGLTDEEIDAWTPEIHVVIRAIEQALKEKNGCA